MDRIFLSGYVIWFFIFSVIGWIFETVYCSIKDGFYQNRGFLYGPVCPIYGLGALLAIIIADVVYCHGYYDRFAAWQIFVIGYVFSAILEYSAHYLLEKKFHATWWDYSDMPLNLHGRICVPASTLFGLSYMGIFKFVYPMVLGMRNGLAPQIQEAVAMICVVILAVDTTLTVTTLKSFEQEMVSMDEVVNTNMIALTKLLKERRSGEDINVTEGVEKTRAQMAADMARRIAANMSSFRVSALNRIKKYSYPKFLNIRIETLRKEIMARNPFLNRRKKQHEGQGKKKED